MMNTNGVRSRSSMLNSLNGLDIGASSPRLDFTEMVDEDSENVHRLGMSTMISFIIGISVTATRSSYLGSPMFVAVERAQSRNSHHEIQNENENRFYTSCDERFPQYLSLYRTLNCNNCTNIDRLARLPIESCIEIDVEILKHDTAGKHIIRTRRKYNNANGRLDYNLTLL